jgi:hypothetical protein
VLCKVGCEAHFKNKEKAVALLCCVFNRKARRQLKDFKTKKNMMYMNYGAEQYFFGICLYAFWSIIRMLFKAIIYCPLIITGYLITTGILDKRDHAVTWMLLIVSLAFILYHIVYLIKGMLIILKARKIYLWIFLFVVCVGFTCVLPAWFFMITVNGIILSHTKENTGIISCMIAVVFGLYIYSRYLFLTDIAPTIAYPAYHLGNWISLKLL